MTETLLSPHSTGTTANGKTCAVSGKHFASKALVKLHDIRPSLADRILQDHPKLTPASLISTVELDKYRSKYVEEMLLAEHGELSQLDKQVAQSLADHDTIAENVDETYGDTMKLGDRLSDKLSKFGGSWKFLIGFGALLFGWMALNSVILGKWDFDPYPFIFLNLILSCVAAVQAPVILMSQRRSEEKDRLRAQSDYRVNLKAELEIRHLHEKLDHLISKQWQRLSEIQQLQLESMQLNNRLLGNRGKEKAKAKKTSQQA
jgi:uncharacterized membrane protein